MGLDLHPSNASVRDARQLHASSQPRHRLLVRWLFVFAAVLFACIATLSRAADARTSDDFLPPEEAFRYRLEVDGDRLLVHWTIVPGYYLYKSRMGVASSMSSVQLGEPEFPPGEIHEDEYFGRQEIFRDRVTVSAPVIRHASAAERLAVELKWQGCADAGLCYPPTVWNAETELPAGASPSARGGGSVDDVFALARGTAQSNADDFLPPEEAFRLSAFPSGPDRVRLEWEIAEGYYLYRGKLAVASGAREVQLGQLDLPKGKTKTDEYFGTQEVYYRDLVATLPVARAPSGALELPLAVTHQGCADAGLCYPPETRQITVTLPPGAGSSTVGFVSEQDRLAALIRSGSLPLVLVTFFGIGLLLSLTPCVLPMVPILSGIIAGQGPHVTTGRAFALSLTYVLGMATTYTLAGALFAAAGQQVQAVFQQPWIVVLFASLFVLLALAMLGAFTLQMPAAIQTRLAAVSNRQTAGTFGGVAVMGALSALIVTTCVAPPLIATLTVIGQSGDMTRGASALFVMSLGMGAPLLVVGASAGKLLPKAGPWMDTVKRFFGVLMLAVAAWMLERIVPERFALLLWAVPVAVAAWIFWGLARQSGPVRWATRAAAAGIAAYAVALVAGATLGATDPLAPLRASAAHEELPFRAIKSVEDLEREVATAKAQGRPVLLDFYADWCVSCKEMEKYTFTDAAVRASLSGALLLRADVTANDDTDKALLRHFEIYGPPTIAFYGPDGVERRNFRVVGFMKAPAFASLAQEALGSQTLAATEP